MTQRPNVLLVTTDQHRGDHLSIAGHPLVETPHLDSMVRHGAYFPNAVTEIPSTTGARCSLHTGKGSYDCGQIGYSGTELKDPNLLAAHMAAAGYHCINVGWRNMHPRRKLYGFHTVIPHELREGDDDYLDFLREELGPNAYEQQPGAHCNGWVARPWPYADELHSTVWTTNVTLEQIRKRDPTKPFFCWISHLRPHSPYDPPRDFWEMYRDQDIPEPPIGDWAEEYRHDNPGLPTITYQGCLTPKQQKRLRAAYMGSISHVDMEIGRLMDSLQKDRLLADTFVVFVSDHGDMQGDHYHFRKGYPYEGAVRIPCILKYPANLDLPKGKFESVVGLQDVMPTILDAVGAPAPEGMTGRSMLDAVRGRPWREFIHGEHAPGGASGVEKLAMKGCHYLTDCKRKFIWMPLMKQEQFFDLEADPRERHDLIDDPKRQDEIDDWRQRLIERLAKRPDGFSDGKRLIPRDEMWDALPEEFSDENIEKNGYPNRGVNQ